jgi:predicted N-acetyltransferase YhbS
MDTIIATSAAVGLIAGALSWLALAPLAVALADWHRGRTARRIHTARAKAGRPPLRYSAPTRFPRATR